ncbi:Cullin repeat-like-containing domain protein [Dipodascopsis uninucleata]
MNSDSNHSTKSDGSSSRRKRRPTVGEGSRHKPKQAVPESRVPLPNDLRIPDIADGVFGNSNNGSISDSRKSIIPSMSTTGTFNTSSGPSSGVSHQHEKVGKLLKRYSSRMAMPSTSFSTTSRHKKKNADKIATKNGLLAVENVTPVSEATYPPLPSIKSGPVGTTSTISELPSLREDRNQTLRQPTTVVPLSRSESPPSEENQAFATSISDNHFPISVKEFRSRDFDPQKYIQKRLADAADYHVKEYLDKLRETKDILSDDIKRNLFDSYRQFLMISSEVATLEYEAKSTRSLVSELSNMVAEMNVSDNKEKESNSGDDIHSNGDSHTTELPVLHRHATRIIRNDSSGSTTTTLVSESKQTGISIKTPPNLLRTISSVSSISGRVADTDNDDEENELEEKLLELDVNIAHHQVEEAVSVIEDIMGSQKSDFDVDPRIKDRLEQMLDILSQDLYSEFTPRRRLISTIKLLARLGYEDEARSRFLSSRSKTVDRRINQVKLDPDDLPFYITQIATILFTLLKCTVEIYVECFPQYKMASYAVEWTKQHIENYGSRFLSCFHGVNTQSEAFWKAVASTKRQSELLKDVGMNMDYLLKDVIEQQRPNSGTNSNSSNRQLTSLINS